MTHFIAHRGNVEGPSSDENRIDYIEHALELGHHVEVDVQLWRGALWLGHDSPQQFAPDKLLTNSNVICHAKTWEVVSVLDNIGCHYFFHNSDDVTITSKRKIWCYPGIHVMSPNAVWLDLHNQPLPDKIPGIYGICGDNVSIMEKIKK